MILSTVNRPESKTRETRIRMGYFDDAIRLPSAKFPEIGDKVEGVVIELGTSTVPDFDDRGRPKGIKYEEDGETPKTQVDVTLDLADGSKVVLHTDGAIFYAIGRALAFVGAEDLEVGDTLSVTYTGDGEPSAVGRNAPKQYTAVVTKSPAKPSKASAKVPAKV